jgi:hypothetical protein
VAKKRVPVVGPDVVRRAELLAVSVWTDGGKPARSLVPQGADPRGIAPLLEYALGRGWLRVQAADASGSAATQGTMVVPGDVSPWPVPEVLSDRERRIRWGPVDPVDL